MTVFVFMLLFVTVSANPRMRGFHKYMTASKSMTAELTSTQDYNVEKLPISVKATFSEPVSEFMKPHCIMVNAVVTDIKPITDSSYEIVIVPDTPGFLSVSLSKSITSSSGASLMSPPILEFKYQGGTVLSSRITTITKSSATITISLSKPADLWGLYVPSSVTQIPSHSSILSQGQLHANSVSTTHVFIITDLQPDSTFFVYFSGIEKFGTIMDISSQSKVIIKTKSEVIDDEDYESKSDGSLCESGWGVSSEIKSLQLLPCSYHGYCKDSRCICSYPYTTSNCGEVEVDSLSHTNRTHQLIHVMMKLYGTFKEQNKLENYWKVSLRNVIANSVSVSMLSVQIRSWNYMETSMKSLSHGNRHLIGSQSQATADPQQVLLTHFTIVTDHDMLELVTKRLNEMVAANDIKNDMKEKFVVLSRVEITQTFDQINDDEWSCYDSIIDSDETDVDCGGSCHNRCTMLKKCKNGNDCVEGLFCTKSKCIDRNWKQVIITTAVIICIIVVTVVIVIFGGIIYQKMKTSRTPKR